MELRFFADENVPRPVVRALRARGLVVEVLESRNRGIGDEFILAGAQKGRCVLLTFDKGFGELAFRKGLSARRGVILFRLSGRTPAIDNARAVDAVASRKDWPGHFAVVMDTRIRMRPMPGG